MNWQATGFRRHFREGGLLTYFTAALARYPTLTFQLRAVFRGVDSVTLLYESVNGLLAAETMILNERHEVSRVLARSDNL